MWGKRVETWCCLTQETICALCTYCVVIVCVSSVLRIEQSLFLIRFLHWQEREAINSSSALTLLQPAFPPSSSNSHFTGIARLHHLPAHILQLVHFVLRITSEYLAGCRRPCPMQGVSLPFLHLCPPWSGPALCSLPLPNPQFYASCSRGILNPQ